MILQQPSCAASGRDGRYALNSYQLLKLVLLALPGPQLTIYLHCMLSRILA
jgi:hypothetical protein